MSEEQLLPPTTAFIEPDPVIEAYKRDVDRTLLRENLKLTYYQRIQKLQGYMNFIEQVREAGVKYRSSR
jgi:hypothetical protein